MEIFVFSLYEFYLLYISFAFVFNISKDLGSFDRTTIFNAMSFLLFGYSDEIRTQLSLRHSTIIQLVIEIVNFRPEII